MRTADRCRAHNRRSEVYESPGHHNVVFCCGLIRRGDGSLLLYYGGDDTVLNLAFSHEDVLAELCLRYGQDPRTGGLLYEPWPHGGG